MTGTDTNRPVAAEQGGHIGDLAVLAAFVAAAFVLRWPALMYSAINFDESMYMLMGREILEGNLPYTTMCDLKPVGLFALFSIFSMFPIDGVIASRLGSSLVVALAAYMMFVIAKMLFSRDGRRIGIVAGAIYIVFSMATGGLTSQSELFHNAFSLLGLLLALRGTLGRDVPSVAMFAAAGLVLGMAVQIKQSVLFDVFAYLAGFFLLTAPSWRDIPAVARRALPAFGAFVAAAAVPTLVILLAYISKGQLDHWVRGNITAHTTFYDEGGVHWLALIRALAEQAPLWLGLIAGLAFARRLVRAPGEWRVIAFLSVWTASVMVLQLFLRIGADHYVLQFLPPLGLLVGWALARSVFNRVETFRARAATLSAMTILGAFAVAQNAYTNAAMVAKDRLLLGQEWAGDTPRQIAADINALAEPGDLIYVVGFQPIVYYYAEAEPATKFVFVGLPHRFKPGRDGCVIRTEEEEMTAVLSKEPRFIVIEDGVFFNNLPPNVKTPLVTQLEQNYEARFSYDTHLAHHLHPFVQFVMNGGAAADVFVRQEGPPGAPEQPAPDGAETDDTAAAPGAAEQTGRADDV